MHFIFIWNLRWEQACVFFVHIWNCLTFTFTLQLFSNQCLSIFLIINVRCHWTVFLFLFFKARCPDNWPDFIYFKFILFSEYDWFFCVYIYALHACPMPMEVKRVYQFPYNLWYGWLWATSRCSQSSVRAQVILTSEPNFQPISHVCRCRDYVEINSVSLLRIVKGWWHATLNINDPKNPQDCWSTAEA